LRRAFLDQTLEVIMVSAMGLGEVVSLDRGDGEGKKDRNKEREGEILGVNQHGGCGVSVLLTVMMVRETRSKGRRSR
jgi:hypothetical protein